MAIPPRISLVTLGVADVEAATLFYERLGWKRSGASVPGTSFIALDGVVLSLFGRGDLAADAGIANTPAGFSGVTLALNQRTREAVDRVLADAVAAGAALGRAGAPAFWGGYTGVFLDPDGHAWEVAYNPGWPLGADGSVQMA
jgi:predicted lactoylglutathione lyase